MSLASGVGASLRQCAFFVAPAVVFVATALWIRPEIVRVRDVPRAPPALTDLPVTLESPAGLTEVSDLPLDQPLLAVMDRNVTVFRKSTASVASLGSMPAAGYEPAPLPLADGRVVFAPGGHIFTLAANGTWVTRGSRIPALRLTLERPDGRIVALERITERDRWRSRLVLVTPGSGTIQPFGPPSLPQAIWSQVGDHRTGRIALSVIGHGIVLMDATGREIRRWPCGEDGVPNHLCLRHDGEEVLFSRGHRIEAVSARGRRVVSTEVEAPAVAADGSIYAMKRDYELWRIDAGGTASPVVRVVDHDGADPERTGFNTTAPVVSADGRYVIATLYRVKRRSREEQQLARAEATASGPAYVPDLYHSGLCRVVVDTRTGRFAKLARYYRSVAWLERGAWR